MNFSERNLEQMRLFYTAFEDRKKYISIPQTLSAELTPKIKYTKTIKKPFAQVFPLSWSHYVILSRINNNNEKSFYEIEATQNNWSIREL